MAPALRTGAGGSSQRLNTPSPLISPLYTSSTIPDHTSSNPYQQPLSPLTCPRALYADSFDRPHSSGSIHIRKNMKDMMGYTTTEEEFDALPMAVRRKYFSSLERLRFAQNSRSSALHDLPIQSHRKSSIADRRGLNLPAIEPKRGAISSRGIRKGKAAVSTNDASWFLTLPEKIRKKEFTREEQVILTARLREKVILDAADEAFYKNSRRASRTLHPNDVPMAPISRTSSDTRRENMAAEIYDSFRWMDEEEDINLKLVLDDYHANLDGAVIPRPDSERRPSFRRQLSISKMPFGRNSMSSSTQPLSPLSPRFDTSHNHNRTKSRAMSLIAPRHTSHGSVTSFDPHATHYQDPEARLKLRVYLASPQKFDEAIEFGFPSTDSVTDSEKDKENRAPRHVREPSSVKRSFGTEKSFLDDTASLFEDDTSMVDPDSPLTPLHSDHTFKPLAPRPAHLQSLHSSNRGSSDLLTRPYVKTSDSYTSCLAGSREMTLRMTLTRPDLRADESQLYGWQSRKSQSPSGDSTANITEEDRFDKGPFGGVDGWGPAEKENSGIKRLWKKVKHPSAQRKVTT